MQIRAHLFFRNSHKEHKEHKEIKEIKEEQIGAIF